MRRALCGMLLLCALPGAAPAAFDGALVRDLGFLGTLGGEPSEARDLDGDGGDELLSVDAYGWWVSSFDPRIGRHSLISASAGGTADTLVAASFADWDGDGGMEVVSLRGNGPLEIHDPWTGRLESRLPLAPYATQMALAELDPAPGLEVALGTGNRVEVYSAAGTLLWSLAFAARVTGLALGNVDTDPALEIAATLAGGDAPVIDCATRSVEWLWPGGFGWYVALADLDGDGVQEIVYLAPGSRVFAVDGAQRSIRWSSAGIYDRRPNLVDTDGDGRAEVLIVGPAEVHLLDGADGSLRAALIQTNSWYSHARIGQLDGDCARELVWRGGEYAWLRLGHPETLALDWGQQGVSAQRGFAVGDSDADGHVEIVRGKRWDSPYVSPLMCLERLDFHHLTPHRTSAMLDGYCAFAAATLLVQADADPALEIVLAGGTSRTERLQAFDGATLAPAWSSDVLGREVYSLASGQADADPELEIAVGADDGSVLLLDAATGATTWSAPAPAGSQYPQVELVDLDGDGLAELVALDATELSIYAGGDQSLRARLSVPGSAALASGDLDGDGDPDVLVGGSDRLVGIDGQDASVLFDEALGSSAFIAAVRVADIDGDSVAEILVAEAIDVSPDRHTQVAVLRLSDRTRLWTGPRMPADYFIPPATLVVADADDDGRKEILCSAFQGIHVLGYGAPAAESDPPRFAPAAPPRVTPRMESGCCPSAHLEWQPAWDAATPPVSYRVYRDLVSGFTPGPANRIARTSRPAFRDPGLNPGTAYYYVVRAVDALGNEDGNLEEAGTIAPATEAIPPAQGNVLLAYRIGTRLCLYYPRASAERIEVFRGELRDRSGSPALGAPQYQRYFCDEPAAPPALLYYDVRGLSPCTNTPGP